MGVVGGISEEKNRLARFLQALAALGWVQGRMKIRKSSRASTYLLGSIGIRSIGLLERRFWDG